MIDNDKSENDYEQSLRPQLLNEFVGQSEIKNLLDIYIKASIKRNETLDHILLYGPPGLGKTTLAKIVSNEMNSSFRVTTGPAIEKPGDLAAILTSLNSGDILFIDEIHRLPKYIEEILYSAMEDYYIDIIIGQDSDLKSIRIDLEPFTLIGATTRFGDLTAPLRDRFGVVFRLDYYSDNDLITIINRTANVYNTPIEELSANNIAKRSRGTPRIANRLFRRVRDFADVMTSGKISNEITNHALLKLGITKEGLDDSNINYLDKLINIYKGGPVGATSLALALGEEVITIEDVYEPYLIKEGYIKRTQRGRIALKKAYDVLDIKFDEGLENK